MGCIFYAEDFVVCSLLLELFQPSNEEMKVKQGDIWRLFREAQQSKSSFDSLFLVLLNFYVYSDVLFFILFIFRHIVLEQTTSHGYRGTEKII
jgi:hypothetical protein